MLATPLTAVLGKKTKKLKHILVLVTVVTAVLTKLRFRFSGKQKSCMHHILFGVTQFFFY